MRSAVPGVRLANRLQDLGFGVERKRDDFEIAGIPKDVLGRFSRRTAIIEKVAEERGITDPDRKGELGTETREKKKHDLTWEKLQQQWGSRLPPSPLAFWAQLASRSLQTVFLAGFATFERQQTVLSSRTSSSRLDVALSASDFWRMLPTPEGRHVPQKPQETQGIFEFNVRSTDVAGHSAGLSLSAFQSIG
jgi:hypothetical protein